MQIDSPWRSDFIGTDVSFYDQLDFTEGSFSLALSSRGMRTQFNSSIFHYLALPVLTNEIEMSINSKTKNIKGAWLKASCFNKEEEMVVMDSVSILSVNNWGTTRLRLKAKGIQYVYIEILAQSDPTSKTFKKLNIDNLQLNFCKSGNDYKERSSISQLTIKNPIEINTDIENCLNKINDFDKHKILALGESVHGSDECQKLAYDVIKYQIQKNKCRLVLFEVPFNFGLIFDNYINEKSCTEITNELMSYNCNVQKFVEFIEWLKLHNSKNKEKVTFLGIDINSELINKKYLVNYLKRIVVEEESFQFISDLLNENKFEEAIPQVEKIKNLDSCNHKVQKIIIYELQKLNLYSKEYSLLKREREKIMFRNAAFAINNLISDSSTAVVYAHLAHVNKLNSYFDKIVPVFGTYMNQYFQEQYYAIALLLGNGEITSNDMFVRGNRFTLKEPVKNSIENLCKSVLVDNFYSVIPQNLSSKSCRIIGYNYSNIQFYPNYAKKRFDAFFFFSESSGYNYPDNWPKTIDEIYEKMGF